MVAVVEKANPYKCFFKNRKVACKSKVGRGLDVSSVLRVKKSKNVNVIEISSGEGYVGRNHVFESSNGEVGKRSHNDYDRIIDGWSLEYYYQNLKQIGEGSYGAVFRAEDKKTGEIVALKMEKEGLDKTSLREIEILRALKGRHPSIVEIKRVVMDEFHDIFIAMEYLEYDLHRLIYANKTPLGSSEEKDLLRQLLEGVKFLHKNKIMHRDLKPSNILLNEFDELKICDFGLSRKFGGFSGAYTARVATLWYKAPELLLGATEYSCAIDMWSVGCIMAELMLKKPLFKGGSEIQQLNEIHRVLGTPNDIIWPGFSSLPGSKAIFVEQPFNVLRDELPVDVLSNLGFDLLYQLLAYDPAKRITAEAALNHAWFQEGPLLVTQCRFFDSSILII